MANLISATEHESAVIVGEGRQPGIWASQRAAERALETYTNQHAAPAEAKNNEVRRDGAAK